MKKTLLALGALALSTLAADASHLKGGLITATCADDPNTSDVEYQVDGILLRDITGAAAPQNMNVTLSSGSTESLAPQGSYMIPYGSGVLEVHVYSSIIALPANAVVDIVYSSCCRPSSIANIPGSPSLYFNSVVNTNAGCNSTPNFLTPPVSVWPDQTPWASSFAAYDLDGDSLVYTLETPMDGPNNNISGYTMPPSMAGGAPTLDASTGVFTYTADGQGLYGLAYVVEAYDANGTMTGSVRLDGVIGVILPPAGNLISVTPPSTVVNGVFTFASGANDTLVLNATSDSSLTASVYFPPYVDSNEVYVNVDVYKIGTTAEVSFAWDPAVYDGTEFPVVVRFESETFAQDYTFMAKSQSSIGVEEVEIDWAIYPNPASDALNIRSEVPFTGIRVIDVNGREMMVQNTDAPVNEMNVGLQLAPSVYFLQLTDENGNVHTESLIVK